MGILEITRQLSKGKLTSLELCTACLQKIERLKELNAFITVSSKVAQEQALESDKRRRNGRTIGPLDGIPVAIKDNYNTKGIRTTCGSRMLSNYIPPYDATMVKKLTSAGAILMGKTNMDEFGMGSGTVDSYYGPTKNPWRSGFKYHLKHPSTDQLSAITQTDGLPGDDWVIPGGSSGGSAVAVATECCFVALGSDTGGSTRNPAARCGVVGLKPTYGLLSRHGLIPLTNSMDVPGIITKRIDDAACLLGILHGHDPYDSTTVYKEYPSFTLPEDPSLYGMHIGLPKEYQCEGMSEEVISLWQEVANLLEEGGAHVSWVSLPHTQYSISCYSVLNCCEVASNFARYDGIEFGHRANDNSSTEALYAMSRSEGFSEVIRGRILAGNYFLLRRNYKTYFEQALKVRRLIDEDFKIAFHKGIDVLLTPVTLSAAPRFSEWVQKDNREQVSVEDYCTQPVNMAGLPAVTLPCKLSKDGLPLSVQLIGKKFHEEQMLTVAKWIEQKQNFPSLCFN